MPAICRSSDNCTQEEMVKLDEAAVQKYYEETGRVPAGIKATRIVKRPNSNVTEMQVIYGKDDDA